MYNTPKKTDCSKKTPVDAVICEKNDVIGQNNVKLCDFIGKTISQLPEGLDLEPLFLGGHCHK